MHGNLQPLNIRLLKIGPWYKKVRNLIIICDGRTSGKNDQDNWVPIGLQEKGPWNLRPSNGWTSENRTHESRVKESSTSANRTWNSGPRILEHRTSKIQSPHQELYGHWRSYQEKLCKHKSCNRCLLTPGCIYEPQNKDHLAHKTSYLLILLIALLLHKQPQRFSLERQGFINTTTVLDSAAVLPYI